jgi:hypothetical protein
VAKQDLKYINFFLKEVVNMLTFGREYTSDTLIRLYKYEKEFLDNAEVNKFFITWFGKASEKNYRLNENLKQYIDYSTKFAIPKTEF